MSWWNIMKDNERYFQRSMTVTLKNICVVCRLKKRHGIVVTYGLIYRHCTWQNMGTVPIKRQLVTFSPQQIYRPMHNFLFCFGIPASGSFYKKHYLIKIISYYWLSKIKVITYHLHCFSPHAAWCVFVMLCNVIFMTMSRDIVICLHLIFSSFLPF